MPMGVLTQLAGIKEAAIVKLHSQALRQLEAVRQALDDCRESVRQLRWG